MDALLGSISALLIALAGLGLMLGFTAPARRLFFAALGLVIAVALLRSGTCLLRATLQSVSLGTGEVLGIGGLGVLVLFGWLSRRASRHGRGLPPRLVRRERTLPPPRFEEERW